MLNRAIITGRLAKDVELRYSQNGNAVASFTVAVSRTFANQNGERETDWINVVTFKKQAENVANFTRKGSLVGIDGRIQTRSYDTDNGKRYVTEIVADTVQFLEPKGSSEGNNTQNQNKQHTGDSGNNQGGSFNGDQVDISDDDLPF